MPFSYVAIYTGSNFGGFSLDLFYYLIFYTSIWYPVLSPILPSPLYLFVSFSYLYYLFHWYFFFLYFESMVLCFLSLFYLCHVICHLRSPLLILTLIPFPHPVIFIWTSLRFITLSVNQPCLNSSKYPYRLSLYPSARSSLSLFSLHFCVLIFFLYHCHSFSLSQDFFFFFWWLLSPFFHLCPASTNERCHGPIDTGWSVCSQR